MVIEALQAREWILLPGTLCTVEVFDGLLAALGVPNSQRRVVPISAPCIKDYEFILDISTEAIVCGFSLGAIVAAHWADRMAAARLILFGVNPLADDPEKEVARMQMMRDVKEIGGAAALSDRLPIFSGLDPDAVKSNVLKMAEFSARDIEAQTQLALSRPGAISALSRASCPVYSLTGQNDVMAPVVFGQKAAQAAPKGQFHLLTGLGHYALLEDASACAEGLVKLEACYFEYL